MQLSHICCSSCHKVGHKKNSKKCENYQNPSISYSVTAALYQSIGLDLNVQKCFCISRKNVKLIINSLEVPYIDYTSTSFCFLGCYLGSAEKTLDSLENYLNSIKKELEVIKTLELEKHLKFFLLKICYAGKITHLLRSLPPSLTYNFCRQFNKIRTQCLAYLMSVDPSILKNHIFSDVQLGGVGFNSSKYLTKAAFIGGGKNFVFEFSRRYPFAENLLENTNSLFLDNLREEISSLSPDLWQSCFPISIQEITDRSLYSLKFALQKLQRHLLKNFENKDFIVRLSTAKKENPAFANFLIDLKDSSSAVLINQIPQIYGLFLNDDQWTTAMRMRCYLWPCNLPNDLFCKCGAGLTLSHLFNCNRYISYRSTLHDAVRDQIHAMCNSYHIESFVEPLLRSLDINESVRDSEYGKRRADVVVPSGCMQEKCLEKCSIRSIPLDDSELYKRKKYANPLKELKHVRHVDYQICPFAISLYGRFGKTALNFIDDFENLVKKRMNKRFDRRLWLNRIVFTIFKSIPKMISKALMSVSAHYEYIAAVRFDGVEACFEDIDF
ncbi:hypothetical protein P9112_009416 [Eukaryota sp. TZLM1-RC]